jgi:pSer/pThr/pTyr-binding forkhead associated (FHA) protein
MAYLIMRRGPEPGKLYRLAEEDVHLGRGSKNDIIIHDNEVSREHLRLRRVTSGYELKDLNSSNGTFINGQPVDKPWLLRSQCIIELGDTITFEFHLGDPDDSRQDADLKINNKKPVYLVVNTESQDEPAVYPLDKPTVTVGRSTTCDIVVIEPEISREHFRLTLNRSGFIIQDMGSTNGTVVNGEIIQTPRLVRTRDSIQVGKTISFQLTDTPENYANLIRTSLLVDTQELKGFEPTQAHRSTSDREVPAIINSQKAMPSEAGTGLDDMALQDQVLLSYAREEWETLVAPVINALYDAKIDAWADQYLTQGSSDWLIATEQARLECWALVVVVSQAALQSDAVRKNWRHFHNREKPIILLMVESVERMPIGASKLKQIQYDTPKAFKQLVAELRRLRRP